jgi:uncharacterized membrane protein YdjX (TVP38/TMEM64 family)
MGLLWLAAANGVPIFTIAAGRHVNCPTKSKFCPPGKGNPIKLAGWHGWFMDLPTVGTRGIGRLGALINRHASPIRAVAGIVILLAVVVMLRWLPLERLLEWLDQQVVALGAWAPLLFVLLFVGLTVFLLPGVPLNVLSGVMFGPLVGGTLTCIASNLSASISFFIGRLLGRNRLSRILRGYPRVQAVYQTLGMEGSWKVVAAVRLSHALPFGLQNFLLGSTPVAFGVYLLTTWAVTLPGIFFIAYFGHIGALTLAAAGQPQPLGALAWWARLGGLLIAAAALLYIGKVVQRSIRERLATLSHHSASSHPEGPRLAETPGTLWTTLPLVIAAILLLATAIWGTWQRIGMGS